MKIRGLHILFGFSFIALAVGGCSTTAKRLALIQESNIGVTLALPQSFVDETSFRDYSVEMNQPVNEDTITVRIDGRDMVLMKAVKDEESGEMVAHQELQAAFVTARFRNVAERHGKIDLEFQIRVPEELLTQAWQLRFYPEMHIMGDTTSLEHVLVTGAGYRRGQMKGYERYYRFINSIVSDTTKFIDIRNLEIFLQRNIPQIYKYKEDSTFVSEVEFVSHFGVSERNAIDHYTNMFSKKMNERRKARTAKMYARYVKAPIVTDNIRLDTVFTEVNGDFVYNYIQTISTRKGLRKVDIVLSGEIYDQEKKLYNIPHTEPLTFYISSLSTFTDKTPRYLTKVIERRAEANAAWNIDFKVGKSDIDLSLGENQAQIDNIKMNLRRLISNEEFILDSITIAAFASPEGTVAANRKLSAQRAASTADYFNRFSRHYRDSLKAEAGMTIVVGEDLEESGMKQAGDFMSDIRFISINGGENWDYLNTLVENSSWMSEEQKQHYRDIQDIRDQDVRETKMKGQPYYAAVRKEMYPRLRKVQFNFFLHRKGMIKDTVHTTVLDTTYMKGVRMLEERDYEGAAALLGPYNDYNAAIAYVSLDRNVSAMNILKDLAKTPQVNYMLAIVYSRLGDERNAVERYLTSCSQDPSYVHRGNLDPEIAALIRKYNLNAQPEEDGLDTF